MIPFARISRVNESQSNESPKFFSCINLLRNMEKYVWKKLIRRKELRVKKQKEEERFRVRVDSARDYTGSSINHARKTITKVVGQRPRTLQRERKIGGSWKNDGNGICLWLWYESVENRLWRVHLCKSFSFSNVDASVGESLRWRFFSWDNTYTVNVTQEYSESFTIEDERAQRCVQRRWKIKGWEKHVVADAALMLKHFFILFSLLFSRLIRTLPATDHNEGHCAREG